MPVQSIRRREPYNVLPRSADTAVEETQPGAVLTGVGITVNE